MWLMRKGLFQDEGTAIDKKQQRGQNLVCGELGKEFEKVK
jgi:hypothetical protein